MHLVAHGQAARDQRLERYAAYFAQRAAERGPEHVADPAQAVEHLGVIAAEAHHLAEALVDRAIGAVPERLVLDHQQRLAFGGHAGHRADGAEMVVGMEREGAGGRLGFGFVEGRSPALEHRNAGHRAPHGAAHALPSDRRAGMQDHAIRRDREWPARRRHHVDEDRVAGEDALERFLVGLFDLFHGLLSPPELAPGDQQVRIAAGGRAPLHVHDLAPWPARSMAKSSSPTLTTRGGAASRSREGSDASVISVPSKQTRSPSSAATFPV